MENKAIIFRLFNFLKLNVVMSSLEPSIFQIIFEQSPAPAMVVKANSSEFTVVAHNRAYERLAADPVAGQLDAIFEEAVREAKTVKLPAGKLDSGEWQQLEVVPLLDSNGIVSHLFCAYYDISTQVGLETERKDGLSKEHDLTEELAASNEELHATNEELSASNEELRQSQESLSTINQELENRVTQRTQALSDSEARFRRMVAQSPVPMLVTMGQSMIFDIINRPMLDLIGKDVSVIGKPWHEAMPELEGQDIITQLLDTYDSGVSWEGSEVPIMIYKSGAPDWAFITSVINPCPKMGKRSVCCNRPST